MQLSKSDLITEIAQRLDGFTKTDIDHVLATYSEVSATYAADGVTVPMPGVGKLTPTYRESRPARNPRTGEQVMTQGKYVVKFKPAKAFEEAVNS
jgi:nucleoid DNA-binding protein